MAGGKNQSRNHKHEFFYFGYKREEKFMSDTKWVTPKLTCLCRTRPEEAVLQSCKGDTEVLGASDTYQGCYALTAPYTCDCCAGMADS